MESVALSNWLNPRQPVLVDWPSVQWNALDFGRVRAQVRAQTAVQEAALATYEKAVLVSLTRGRKRDRGVRRGAESHRALIDEVADNRRSLDMAKQSVCRWTHKIFSTFWMCADHCFNRTTCWRERPSRLARSHRPLQGVGRGLGDAATGADACNRRCAMTAAASMRHSSWGMFASAFAARRRIGAGARRHFLLPAPGLPGSFGWPGRVRAKTTLIRLLGRAHEARWRTIRVLGIDAAKDPQAIQSRISYMPQQFGLYEDLTVRENLDLYADMHGVSADQRRSQYARLMAMTGLEPFSKAAGGQLSGGMKQKTRPGLHAASGAPNCWSWMNRRSGSIRFRVASCGKSSVNDQGRSDGPAQ